MIELYNATATTKEKKDYIHYLMCLFFIWIIYFVKVKCVGKADDPLTLLRESVVFKSQTQNSNKHESSMEENSSLTKTQY